MPRLPDAFKKSMVNNTPFHNNMLNLKANNLHFCQSQDSSVGWQLDCYSLANQRLRAQEGFGVVCAL